MSSIAEIQRAIISLTNSDYAQLMRWLNDYDWGEWDRQIEEDSAEGKLDFLVSQAAEAKRQGTLEDL